MKIADHYSFVAEHPKTYEIHDARDNKTFHVSKKGLSLATQKKMAGIKKYAEGGEVDEEKTQDPFSNLPFLTPTPNPVMTPAAQAPVSGELGEMSRQPQSPQGASGTWSPGSEAKYEYDTPPWMMKPGTTEPAPMQSTNPENLEFATEPQKGPVQAPVSDQQTSPVVSQPTSKPVDPFGMQMKAADSQYNAQAKQASLMEQMYSNQEKRAQEIKQEFDKMMEVRNKRSQELFDAYQRSEINPNRFMQNMSTGSKIASAIGVMLGGLAQGLMGTDKNPGLTALNTAIERDLESQRLAGDKANNLYNQYLKETGDKYQAYNMAKQDLLTLAGAQANKIAAQMGTPQAAAQRDMLKAQIGAQIQNANKNMMANQVSNYATVNGIPAEALPMVPEEQRKRMVKLPNGLWADAGNPDKAQRFSQFEERHNSIKSELEILKSLVKDKGTYELLGPHNEKLLSGIESIATDSAKLFDPSSVARESEVAQFKRMLFEPNKFSMTNSTALQILDNYEKMLDRRAQEQWQSIPAYQNSIMKRKALDKSVSQFEQKRK